MNTSIENRILVYEKDGSSLKPIKIYYDEQGKKWIESRPNTKFVIEIKNNNYENYLAVVSVDGLNVIDAKRAKLEPHNGYVLYAKTSMKIPGWRTSMSEVREFMFTSNKNDSYTHKLGADESNRGVIGLAFFKEKSKWLSSSGTYYAWPPIYSSSTSYSSGNTFNTATNISFTANSVINNSSTSNLRSFDKGLSMSTAQGDKVADSACKIDKEFECLADCIDAIYYDSRENLVAKGIIRENTESLPQPFENSGFCPSL